MPNERSERREKFTLVKDEMEKRPPAKKKKVTEYAFFPYAKKATVLFTAK